MSTRHPLRDLLARYRAIFQHAWAHRTELAGPTRLASELAFLPAALFERWSGRCVGALHQHLANLRAHALRELHG